MTTMKAVSAAVLAILLGIVGCGQETPSTQGNPEEQAKAQASPAHNPEMDQTPLPRAFPEGLDTQAVKKLLARTSAMLTIKVTGQQEIDTTTGCSGEHVRRYSFDVLASSGDASLDLAMHLPGGTPGHSPHPPVKTPAEIKAEHHARLKELDTRFMQIGGTYTLLLGHMPPDQWEAVTGERGRHTLVPYGVLAWWDEAGAPSTVTQAIREDRYAWRPTFFGHGGFAIGHEIIDDQRWRLIARDDDEKTLWKFEIDGQPGPPKQVGAGTFAALSFTDHRYLAQPIQPELEPEENHYLLSYTLSQLPDGNRFELPAGDYRVMQVRLLPKGELIVQKASLAHWDWYKASRQYRRDTGVVQFTEHIDHDAKGGLALGLPTERYIRTTQRFYDAKGKLKQTKAFGYQKIFDADGRLVSHGNVPLNLK